MWNEIKEVWLKQLQLARDAWKECWYSVKDTIINALLIIANFIWAVIETVIFLPIKTGLYETGKIIVKHLIDLIKKM